MSGRSNSLQERKNFDALGTFCAVSDQLNKKNETKKLKIFQIVTNLITPHEYEYEFLSPIYLQSCCQFHESGSDNPFQRYIHSNFAKTACGRLLDMVQPEVDPSIR